VKKHIESAVIYAVKVKKLYDDNHIAAYSAQAAFFVLLSAVPLIMMAVMLLGVFFAQGSTITAASDYFSQQLPTAAQLLEEIEKLPSVPLVSVTTVFLVWAATNGIRSIARGLGNIFGGEERYNIIQLALRSVGYAFVMFVTGIATVAVLVFASPLEAAATAVLGRWAKVVLLVLNLRNVIFFAAFTLLFAIAYKGLAKSSLSFKQQLAGASVAALGWILYSSGFSVYIKYFSRYSILYGSFGAVMLFMLWLYMCMSILLCGALINRLLCSKKCD